MTRTLVALMGGHGPDLATPVVLTLAAALTAIVAGLAVAAFVQRRSRPYLLVALALLALLARTAVGVGAYASVLDADQHHLLEHGLDVVMAALVIAAVYLVRPAGEGPAVRRADGGRESAEASGERTDGGRDPADPAVDGAVEERGRPDLDDDATARERDGEVRR